MADTGPEGVREALPAIDAIEDDRIREGVLDAWVRSLDETGWTLAEVPWYPPIQQDLDLPDERLVDHVNDVCALAVDVAEGLLDRRGVAVSMDLVVAGALLHDVSKLYEFDAEGDTPVFDLLGHPYYGVHVVAAADLSVEITHIVLSHTGQTTVDPATIEAEIVRRADQVAASAIKMDGLDDLRRA